MVLKIERVESNGLTVFMLVGSLGSQEVQQLKAHIGEARNGFALDLDQVRLVGLDAAHFLATAERSGVELRRAPRYVREWIDLERLTMKGKAMERMLVVVFDNEKKAYEGKSALLQLELEGSITIYAGAVVTKHADGSASVKQYDDFGPLGSLTGTAMGGLVGLLGGPVAAGVGALSGLALGSLYDIHHALVGADFVDDVSSSLTPNKVAVIAEIHEEWTTPIDTRMETLGGTVFRRAISEVRKEARDEEVAAMKADIAKLKEEVAKTDAARRAKLKGKIEELQAKMDALRANAEKRRQAFEARQKAKAQILKKNAQAAGHALKELAKTPL